MDKRTPFKKSFLHLSLASLLVGLSLGQESAAESSVEDEVKWLHDRVTHLEGKLAEAANEEPEEEVEASWSDRVTIGGVVMVDASYTSADEGDSSDIIISDAELWAEAEIAENLSAIVLFYYEDGYDAPDLDEAYISFSPESAAPLTFTAGRTYLPFGHFETNMVSDPLTLELGEIREDMLMVSAESDGFYGGFYLFNGDLNEEGSPDVIEHFGLQLGYAYEDGDNAFEMGMGWINSLQDTDGVEWLYTDNDLDTVTEYADAIAMHASGRMGPVSVFTEYVGALDDVAGPNTNTKFTAWNIEAGYDFMMNGMDSTVAVGYQATDEAEVLELPEERVIGTLSMNVIENTTLAIEYKKDTDYEGEDYHTGTAQVAVEF